MSIKNKRTVKPIIGSKERKPRSRNTIKISDAEKRIRTEIEAERAKRTVNIPREGNAAYQMLSYISMYGINDIEIIWENTNNMEFIFSKESEADNFRKNFLNA